MDYQAILLQAFVQLQHAVNSVCRFAIWTNSSLSSAINTRNLWLFQQNLIENGRVLFDVFYKFSIVVGLLSRPSKALQWSHLAECGWCYNSLCSSMCQLHSLSPRKRGNMFSPSLVCVSVCVSVYMCLSVTTITRKIVDGFAPNFMRKFLGEKGRPSSCFVMIGRKMWKQRSKNSVNRRLFTN